MLTELLLFVSFVLVIYLNIPSKPPNLPPGLWGWPVVGALPKSGRSFMKQVLDLRKQHGDIVSWRMGSRMLIFLCNYDIIKDVLSRAEASDRPSFYSFQSVTHFTGGGLINSSGKTWQSNRRFALRHLRDLGFGKRSLEIAIQKEAAALVDSFKKQLGSPQSLPWSINVAVLNVLWKLVAGVRYEVDDPHIIKMSKLVEELFHAFEGPIKWLDYFPWLIPLIPEFLKKMIGMKFMHEVFAKLKNTFTKIVEEHCAKLDPGNPNDFIDSYLVEMKNNSSSNSHMSLDDLEIILSDLFIAGSDTTSSTIRWAIIYLAKYPEIQKRVQKEIDSVIPKNRLPSLQDKEKMPYVDAMIHELHRIISLAALAVPHFASEDIEVGKYIIPKGSVIFPHLYSCHTDTNYWDKPDVFNPENFLDDHGKVKRNKNGFAPFSLGRRMCVGESLVRMEFFIILTALLQNFTFETAEGEELNTDRAPDEMFLHLPKEVKLIVNQR